ncbi:protein transport protein SEC31 [Drosophila serrata]|uniref:protein transport protein SEC31 n=1 Tax=Drosophila serrata TaxID=7274 RepID=UPI000A1CF583|nr:protein transport protein SEC31 [Drosophila serrata]
MNLLMDSMPSHANPGQRRSTPPQHAELRISTSSPQQQQQHQQQQPPAQQQNSHNHNNNNNNNETPTSPSAGGKTTLKRAFDVAFLMMPDERIKQKQAEKQARLQEALLQHHHHQQQQQQHHHQQQQHQQQMNHYPTDLSPRGASSQPPSPAALEYISLLEARQRYPQISIRSPRVYDDPSVIIPLVDSPEAPASTSPPPPMRSAFTKVASSSLSTASSSPSTTSRLESPVDVVAPPLSPDQLSCHSISPPLVTPPPRTNSGGQNPQTSLPANPIVYHNFRPEYQFNGAFQAVNPMQALQAQQRLKQQLLYTRPPGPAGGNPNGGGPLPGNPSSPPAGPPPEFLHAAYPGFAPPPHPFAVAQPLQNPAAAAILSTLIPPTLASTFTLTAQNVCAKCNISFRMTSDLVYHMRSHHKSEVACDPNRRKREEKLRCPVCQETFRERHHLTRHMTAHQDKASDHQPQLEDASSSSAAAAAAAGDNEIINVVGGTPPGRRMGGMPK